MTDLSDLPPLVRARRYLDLAADARRGAVMVKGRLRDAYIDIAQNWEMLAEQAAKQAEKEAESGD